MGGRDGTHQPHRIRSPPPLAATTHHPSPATRPNRMPTLRSPDSLGHTRPTNQPRSRPHHTRQQGRTQHPRQRPNHLQNMQQKQRQQKRTKHPIPTTNHKNIDPMVKTSQPPPGPPPAHPCKTSYGLVKYLPFVVLSFCRHFSLCVGGECGAA